MSIHIYLIHGGSFLRHSLSNDDLAELASYMEARFGLDRNIFQSYHWEKSAHDFWMMPKELSDFTAIDEEIEKRGLRAFNGDKKPPKPTTIFIQRFSRHFSKNIIDLSESDFKDIIDKKLLIGRAIGIERGFVLLRRYGVCLGCGFTRGDDVESHLPKRLTHSISPKFL